MQYAKGVWLHKTIAYYWFVGSKPDYLIDVVNRHGDNNTWNLCGVNYDITHTEALYKLQTI